MLAPRSRSWSRFVTVDWLENRRPSQAALALCAALAVWTSPVAAQTFVPQPGTAYANGYGPSSLQIAVPVIATVGGRCGFATGGAPSGTKIAGAIDENAWLQDFGFTLECTGPSRLAITSANGGLKTSGNSAPGYAVLAPYDVAVSITRSGGVTSGNCAASELLEGATGNCPLRGTASPTVGLFVASPSFALSGSYVRLSAPAYSGPGVLVAGSYSDTLTLTISPAS